jgi:hypothetical protein
VRFVDIVFIQKYEDGNTRTIELSDLDPEAYEMFVPMGEHVSSLFTNDDLEIAASRLPAGSAAALFLWENLWSPISAGPSWMPAANWWSAPRSLPKSSESSSRDSPPSSARSGGENEAQIERQGDGVPAGAHRPSLTTY